MPRSLAPALGRFVAAAMLAAFAVLSLPARAHAQDPADQLATRLQLEQQRAAFRQLQHQMLLQGARARIREGREHAELVRRARHGSVAARRALNKVRKASDEEGPVPAEALNPARQAEAPAGAQATSAIPVNVRANNPVGDGGTAGQCEESVAALGDYVVVAWNDGQGFVTGGDTQGFGYSSDGGVTFTDGGDVPHPPAFPAWAWASDPVMAVNEKTGEFWYCGLTDADASNNAIGVARGHFTGSSFAFDSVFAVRIASNASFFLDKQWLAVDSLSGNLYVTNTTFTTTGDQIDFYRSTNAGRTWSAAVTISSGTDNGWVQGSRVVVGPGGEVHTVWQGLEQSLAIDTDHYRYRKSTNGGVSFAPEVNAADYVSNFGTGSPGFNRERGLTFPSIAVDRTTGTHRGRVYLTWNESWDWLDAPFVARPAPAGTIRLESDPSGTNTTNNTTATANAFTIGQFLRGTLQKTGGVQDMDYFSVALNAGDRIVVWADSFTTVRAFTLRLFAPNPDGAQRLCYGGKTDSTSSQTNALWNFMAPVSGTYYLRISAISHRTMTYSIRTSYDSRASERGRDQRDAFTSFSDDGTTWATPAMMNDDATGLDEYLPEVAVGADGLPYAMWFDYRDDLYGSRAHVYMSRSTDGGLSWAANQRVTSAQSNFTTSPVNIAPNMGDYSHMAASTTALHPVWADGRATNTSVDVFTAAVLTTSSIQSCPNDTTMGPTGVASAGWTLANDNPFFAGTYAVSLASARAWTVSGPPTIVVPSQGTAFYTASVSVPDTAAAGTNTICLTFTSPGGVVIGQCCYNVTVTGGALGVGDHLAGFALAPSWPNPARGSARIAFSLPASGHAKLRVYDLAGARVRTLVDGQLAAGQNSALWDGRDDGGNIVRAGAYFYRLEFAGRALTQRLILMK
jgi:hypothetical protein